jgi:MFS family permease
LWLSWGLGLANFLFTFPAYFWIDKYGRRFLLLATYPGMILSLLGACLSFLGGDSQDDTSRIVRVCVFIFLFILFYSLGQGPGKCTQSSGSPTGPARDFRVLISLAVAFAYAAEVFPLWNREAGMSAMLCINLTAAGKLASHLAIPHLSRELSGFHNLKTLASDY